MKLEVVHIETDTLLGYHGLSWAVMQYDQLLAAFANKCDAEQYLDLRENHAEDNEREADWSD